HLHGESQIHEIVSDLIFLSSGNRMDSKDQLQILMCYYLDVSDGLESVEDFNSVDPQAFFVGVIVDKEEDLVGGLEIGTQGIFGSNAQVARTINDGRLLAFEIPRKAMKDVLDQYPGYDKP